MNELQQYLSIILETDFNKIIISNPASKSEEYQKLVIERRKDFRQISKYTQKQVFHENVKKEELADRCVELIAGHYRQVNAMTADAEHIILIAKNGKCNYKVKRLATEAIKASKGVGAGSVKETAAWGMTLDNGHNRRKNYILSEGMSIEPLVDMGVFTKDGRVVNSMYDKYKQINRFVEILNDEISNLKVKKLNVIDFGCGKSYLTFVVYYYLTEVMGLEVNMIGLDLKADVIEKCNRAAEKYHYDKLHFELGDINGYKAPFDVDMVITLHACDTATDFALFNAIQWKAKMIFSVPFCQHEFNKQMKPSTLPIMSRYGIIKERFAALATDAVRANLLEYSGYRTQLLEFIDFDHTPKNILIRAVYRPVVPKSVKENALNEVHALMKEFAFEPTLYKLLGIGEKQ
jgi:hypothetical protein